MASIRSLLRTIACDAGDALLARYFGLSYRVLGTAAGRDFLQAARGRDVPAVHGYATAGDVTALIQALRPSPDDVVVDLGCGMGEVAIAVHRRTGCNMLGVDASARAVEEARRRADEDGVAAAVRFEVANVGAAAVRGSAAYALDSLMFIRRAPEALAVVSESLAPPGRVFATFIDHRGLDRDAFARYIAAGGVRLEHLDDVTAEFADQSARRAAAARRVLRARPLRDGQLGLLLVLAEEATIGWLIRRRRLRRWRFTIIRAATVAPLNSSLTVSR